MQAYKIRQLEKYGLCAICWSLVQQNAWHENSAQPVHLSVCGNSLPQGTDSLKAACLSLQAVRLVSFFTGNVLSCFYLLVLIFCLVSYYLFFKIEDQLFKIEFSSSLGEKRDGVFGESISICASMELCIIIYPISVALFIRYFNYLCFCCSFPSFPEVILYV